MCIRSTCDRSSSRCSQATRKLDLLDPSRLIPNLNQHDSVLHSNHDSRIFAFLCIPVEIQPTDPAAVIDLCGSKGRAELRQHVERNGAIAENTCLVY